MSESLEELYDEEETISREIKTLDWKLQAEGHQELDTQLTFARLRLQLVKDNINSILNEVREEKGVWGLF